ncbi:2-oxoglutarate dehydrogenase E1 component [Gemmata sp. JC717]|uniref:2-oxoglutarate dehydrogenase E1 component n=1 Tax=Gemmata algarum TaxID=2975278 RepID=UPI0021BB63FC|nr:2-oxoglutarate dehydrogenase E1 component [Gemmata algarum]MDY3553592.1 2-oxoglutarate dehydrogenase E1 component [Gemmata algarum]
MFSENGEYVEAQFRRWQQDKTSVDQTWQAFFAGMQFAGTLPGGTAPAGGSGSGAASSADLRVQTGVTRLVFWYRQAGHLQADVDPLASDPPPPSPLLKLENFGLSEADLDRTVDGSMYFGLNSPATLRDLLATLKATYCGTTGFEYMHIDSLDVRSWIASRLEPTCNRPMLKLRQKYRILLTLHQAELFEKFLHTKYVGQKRFSLEGGETLIPVLDAIIEKGPSLGVKEVVIGMAHRGRLNVLANTLHKPFSEIFNEFEDNYLPLSTHDGDGDVKYHLGFSADVETADGGKVHLSVTPNPSHLEIVNPVVEGRVRAKQRKHGDKERVTGVPVLIHGDAAFAGQGVIMETFNLMNLAGYRTGGTIHIVVNNQIGFTTNPRDSRSTQYCTDIAKFIQAPILHVNAEDPEACVAAAEFALEFRQQFKRDVVIDLVCYRRWGHNEGDNPGYTQPLQAKVIAQKKPLSTIYAAKLAGATEDPSVTEAVVADIVREFDQKLSESLRDAEAVAAAYRNQLEAAHQQVKEMVKKGETKKRGMEGFSGRWKGFTNRYSHDPIATGIGDAVLDRVGAALGTFPDGFTVHPNLLKILLTRSENIKKRGSVDWGTGEALAIGSLVLDGVPVRLSGQDSRRGTFTQRHAVVVDYETGSDYYPLQNLDPKQAPFDVIDSSLSEAAVMGFEFGYSLDDPESLVMWEAQFGDFANGAQVIIDQFLTSCESKWNRSSGLVLLLPHAYEGQGPEHSSARLERFLQMCAEDNIQVAYPTTPAQYFHLLRRQVKRGFRKPLVVMTPKSLLRLPAAVSPVSEFADGTHFREVLDDDRRGSQGEPAGGSPSQDRRGSQGEPAGGSPSHKDSADLVTRVLVCSGKVYYDLVKKRDELKTQAVAILRLEQLYPWPEAQLSAALSKYRRAREFLWVQEESQNMGGWSFVEPRLRAMSFPFEYIGRDASASPATGSHHVHELEQKLLVDAAFAPTPSGPIGPGWVGWKTAATTINGAHANGHTGAEDKTAITGVKAGAPGA